MATEGGELPVGGGGAALPAQQHREPAPAHAVRVLRYHPLLLLDEQQSRLRRQLAGRKQDHTHQGLSPIPTLRAQT